MEKNKTIKSQQRQRPLEEQDRVLDSLDEIEQLAKVKVADGQITSLGRKMNLEWSHKKVGFLVFVAHLLSLFKCYFTFDIVIT